MIRRFLIKLILALTPVIGLRVSQSLLKLVGIEVTIDVVHLSQDNYEQEIRDIIRAS